MKDFDVSTIPSLTGKNIVVTGGTAGLGKATVSIFAAHSPAHILFTGRNAERANALVASLKESHPAVKVTFIPCDLASLASVASAAASINASIDTLDILLCNAGIMAVPPALSADGYEIQFATNHLGHAALIKPLLPALERAAAATGDARVVLLTSQGMSLAPSGGIVFDTLRTTQASRFGHWVRYGQSKLANALYAAELARRHPLLSTASVHPGVIATDLVGTLGFWDRALVYATTIGSMVTPAQGVQNSLWASTAERSEIVSGTYYEPVGELRAAPRKYAVDEELAARLWEWTEAALAGTALDSQ